MASTTPEGDPPQTPPSTQARANADSPETPPSTGVDSDALPEEESLYVQLPYKTKTSFEVDTAALLEMCKNHQEEFLLVHGKVNLTAGSGLQEDIRMRLPAGPYVNQRSVLAATRAWRQKRANEIAIMKAECCRKSLALSKKVSEDKLKRHVESAAMNTENAQRQAKWSKATCKRYDATLSRATDGLERAIKRRRVGDTQYDRHSARAEASASIIKASGADKGRKLVHLDRSIRNQTNQSTMLTSLEEREKNIESENKKRRTENRVGEVSARLASCINVMKKNLAVKADPSRPNPAPKKSPAVKAKADGQMKEELIAAKEQSRSDVLVSESRTRQTRIRRTMPKSFVEPASTVTLDFRSNPLPSTGGTVPQFPSYVAKGGGVVMNPEQGGTMFSEEASNQSGTSDPGPDVRSRLE